MLVAEFDIISAGPLMFGKKIRAEKTTGESPDAYEKRTWRERLHVNTDGCVFIPAIALKRTLENIAQYLSESVPGKGKATWTKYFKAGMMIIEDILIQPLTKADDVQGLWLNVPADGRRGGSKRVDRCFPVIPQWNGHAEVILQDPLLMDNSGKVEEYVIHAGKFIGLLSMSPRSGGNYGRFRIENFKTRKMKTK